MGCLEATMACLEATDWLSGIGQGSSGRSPGALGLVMEAPGGKIAKTLVLSIKIKGSMGGPGILGK